MTVIDFQQRRQRAIDCGEKYRAGEMTADVFRASLTALGLRKDDISGALADNAPAARYDAEQARYEASIEWLREFLGRK